MSLRTRILLGIGLILVSLGMGYLLFRLFFSTNPLQITPRQTDSSEQTDPSRFPTGSQVDRQPTGTDVTPGQLPDSTSRNASGQEVPAETAIARTVFDGRAQDTTVVNGQVQFYNQDDGKFYRMSANGTLDELSDEVFFSAQSITWDGNGNKAIIEYPDGANIVYNFQNKQQVTLPQHWEDFSFSSDGNTIAAKSLPVSPENRWLVTTDATGQNTKLIEPMGNNADKVIIDWSANRQVVAFSRTGQALGADRQEVLLVGLNGENFKSLIVEGRDFRPMWTPDGDKVLYSIYSPRSDFRPELWITNASGDDIGTGRKFLNINTWADKCAFGSDARYVYCGVPESLERGAGFVPDTANLTPDIIYRIDVTTGARTPITQLGETFVVVDSLQVDDTNHKLYATNKTDNSIIQIDI